MFTDILQEFQNITKYPIFDFLDRYCDFMENGFPVLRRYFNGDTENIDNKYFNQLTTLTNDCHDVITLFNSFANKLQNCGYWELLDYMQQLNDDIEKANKMPKFLRSSLAARGYTPAVQTSASVGGMRTMEDVASIVSSMNKENIGWVDLMLNNDLNEDDWDIDQLSKINVYINKSKVIVTTIVDQPIGNRVYGIDINRKIAYRDNDLALVQYEDNVEQKVNVLCSLAAGDVPENPLFGRSNFFCGTDIQQFSYPNIAEQVVNTFLQDDLFNSVIITDITFEEGSLVMSLDITTKYDYKTQNKIVI